MLHSAKEIEDQFYKFICVGLGVMYATQVLLTIGGAIKFIPSTGVTLPLVSYGGSSLLASLLMFGMLQGLIIKCHGTEKIVEIQENKDNIKCKINNQTEYSLVFYIFAAIFAAMVLYFLYFMIFESPIYIYSEYNKLMS